MCRPELSVLCGGWRGPCLLKDLVRLEALYKGKLGRDSQALLIRGVGSLANSWIFLFLARATFMLPFSPPAKWGMLLPISYFPGSPNLIFQSVICSKRSYPASTCNRSYTMCLGCPSDQHRHAFCSCGTVGLHSI